MRKRNHTYFSVIIVVSFLLIFARSYSQEFNPVINQIISKIAIDSLVRTVNDLSGENPVLINNQEIVIKSRQWDSEHNANAQKYLEERLISYGLETSIQCPNQRCCNILGFKEGILNPETYILIGAHYDDMSYNGDAPGANDNGSGCALVLEAARIFQDYDTDYSIIFAFWDEEELGMLGSKEFAAQCALNNVNIEVVINLDMLAWDKNDSRKTKIKMKRVGNFNNLINIATTLNSIYNCGLEVFTTYPDYYGTGDCDYFWHNGYNAISFADNMEYMDAYHSIFDRINLFNLNYYLRNSRLMIAYLSQFSGVSLKTENVDDYYFNNIQIFPNPANEECYL